MLYEQKLSKELDWILKLQGQINLLKSLSNELSAIAEQTILRNWELEEEAWADIEIAQLKESTALEVDKAVVTRHCRELEEVNRISSLANQSGGIKAYLEDFKEDGGLVSVARLESLDADKKEYLEEFDALDVVEITDADFEVTLPCDPALSVERVMSEAAPDLDQYGTHMLQDETTEDVYSEDGAGSSSSAAKHLAFREDLAHDAGSPAAQLDLTLTLLL
ncbi:unnamed protein product [Arabis nemorensis]|uniref:Uncharacterized protein n=1 Tax=Arabis nemorensis TaxID=586526 RepID=A0A565B325_9BRAS|nr:unnamed protein product [Arabis nemorensis]